MPNTAHKALQKAYRLAKPLVFCLPAESAHHLTLASLSCLANGLPQAYYPATPRQLMGLTFPNAVGLAAGLDKNAEYVDGLSKLGFGFIEVGTVTPLAQDGNAKPRLFRLPDQQAIINRMGFNNRGLAYLLDRVKNLRYRGILGINLGKNARTPLAQAIDDYLLGLRQVYAHASYVAINISSPNTVGLRDLQAQEPLSVLLAGLKQEQSILAQAHGRYVPLVIKISPDVDEAQLAMIASVLLRYELDGVIATNTTLSRVGVFGKHSQESGGLSGAPLQALSTRIVRQLAQHLQGAMPIIAVGGIMDGASARAKIEAGASLVQLYSGLIYQGTGLVGEAIQAVG